MFDAICRVLDPCSVCHIGRNSQDVTTGAANLFADSLDAGRVAGEYDPVAVAGQCNSGGTPNPTDPPVTTAISGIFFLPRVIIALRICANTPSVVESPRRGAAEEVRKPPKADAQMRECRESSPLQSLPTFVDVAKIQHPSLCMSEFTDRPLRMSLGQLGNAAQYPAMAGLLPGRNKSRGITHDNRFRTHFSNQRTQSH